jgi:hypothetical protein
MWNARRSSLAFAALLGASSSVGAEPTPNPTAQARISAAYGKLPLTFEANEGQVERPVKFLARGPGATLFLTPTEAVLSLGGAQHKTAVVRMQLVGANRAPHLSGLDLQETRSNYFIGNDSRQWHTGVAHYARSARRACTRAWISSITATSACSSTTSSLPLGPTLGGSG